MTPYATACAASHRVVALDVERTRRRHRSSRGGELASDADAMVAKTKRAFEHQRVDVSEVLARDDGEGARTRAEFGGSTGRRDIEWSGDAIDVEATYADVLERIIEAFEAYAARLRAAKDVDGGMGATTTAATTTRDDETSRGTKKKKRNAEDAEDGAKRVKTDKKRTPMSSPVKGSSVSHWISDKRDRPKLRALADADHA